MDNKESSVTLTDLQLDKLFPTNKLFDRLNSVEQGNGLNGYFYYSSKTDSIYIVKKDSTGFMALRLEGGITVVGDPEDKVFYIPTSTVFDALETYLGAPKELIDTLQISFGTSASGSFFNITSSKDKLQFPHMPQGVMEGEEIYKLIIEALYSEFDHPALLIPYSTETLDAFIAISENLGFIGSDEAKNNALAIYINKIMTNNKAHIFEYHLSSDYSQYFKDPDAPVYIHKNPAKIITALRKAKVPFTFSVSSDLSRISIRNSDIGCVMNNAMSSITPPTTEQLEMIGSSDLSTTIQSARLYGTLGLFSKFYTSQGQNNPVTFEYNSDGLRLLLRDNSGAASTACSIERNIDCEINAKTIGTRGTVIYDSILGFLDLLDTDVPVQIFDAQDKPAIVVVAGSRTVYLGKFAKD